ncbi:MAG: DEAD/DEAH box helicase [bacterium]|nr:DEAD/DEAH box helicase [bacterium]
MTKPAEGFSELNLISPIVEAVSELGYESPLPIQSSCIPPLLEGKDVLGLAQTGTGKTGAFALPLLSNIDLDLNSPQVLVLAPTRELAIQVAEAFQAYARHLKGFHVVPIYGGQRYSFQFSQLKRGPQVIVGTPGRILDHLSRGTLDLSKIKTFVLDEADEMLRMGFVEDVETIMSHAPDEKQMALFSATMPPQIKRISKKYLKDPVEIRIKAKTSTAENIEQVYLVVPNSAKFEALARILETESYDGILIFSRTRLGTMELAEKLAARGFDVAALNGDMDQRARERTVNRLKRGDIDIVVATDVAARGLDVERISLVVNFDIPGDSEAYIHRIGRTGRVGRYGKAILFANPREKRLLLAIERATRQPLKKMEMPSHDTVTRKRIDKFRDQMLQMMENESLEFFQDLSFELMEEMDVDLLQLTAATLYMAQKDRPLQAEDTRALNNRGFDEPKRGRNERGSNDRGRPERGGERGQGRGRQLKNMALFRIEVGSKDNVEIRNIVGAVANETSIRSQFIGQIRIHPDFSTIELPDDLPQSIVDHLKTTHVGKKQMRISRCKGDGPWSCGGGGGSGGAKKDTGAGTDAQVGTGKPWKKKKKFKKKKNKDKGKKK